MRRAFVSVCVCWLASARAGAIGDCHTLHVLLRREVGAINHKRVYRLYREEGLLMRRRKRKRVAFVPRGTQPQTWKRGEAWSMDFMQDVLIDGRRFRTLNILDLVTRECLAIAVDTSLPGQRGTHVPRTRPTRQLAGGA